MVLLGVLPLRDYEDSEDLKSRNLQYARIRVQGQECRVTGHVLARDDLSQGCNYLMIMCFPANQANLQPPILDLVLPPQDPKHSPLPSVLRLCKTKTLQVPKGPKSFLLGSSRSRCSPSRLARHWIRILLP